MGGREFSSSVHRERERERANMLRRPFAATFRDYVILLTQLPSIRLSNCSRPIRVSIWEPGTVNWSQLSTRWSCVMCQSLLLPSKAEPWVAVMYSLRGRHGAERAVKMGPRRRWLVDNAVCAAAAAVRRFVGWHTARWLNQNHKNHLLQYEQPHAGLKVFLGSRVLCALFWNLQPCLPPLQWKFQNKTPISSQFIRRLDNS